MHAEHGSFLEALSTCHRMSVRFKNPKNGQEVTRVCAPLDYGPLRGATSTAPVYQFWDLEGKRKPLNLPLAAENILSMQTMDETFDPGTIITWAFKPNAWHVVRDWGAFS
jgi:hypothetical protein